MTRTAMLLAIALCAVMAGPSARSQETSSWVIEPLTGEGWVEYDFARHEARATNGVKIQFGGAVLTAQSATVNQQTGDAVAEGRVRIQREEQVWASEHLRYNFQDRRMQASQFRTAKPPVYAAGAGLDADLTNRVYNATNALITTDDAERPLIKIRAKHIRIVPGEKIEARHATLYIGVVPVFYFPYYSRSLGPHANNFSFLPGYRRSFGPFVLGSYQWFLGDEFDGFLHADYRQRRGPGLGPDVNYHFGKWGDGSLLYYYTHDENPNVDDRGAGVPHDRQRASFSYLATPVTNVEARAVVRYETDRNVVRDFFEGEYRRNSQPSTFIEAEKRWPNFSLDAYVQPRVNEFLETVERLPELRLTAWRQQIGPTPFYYESETSAGYYRRLFAETNGPPLGARYAAGRADTYHQVLLPRTLFGWLNVTPRAGGRLSWYSEATGPGAVTEEIDRQVFNTGAEVSFKASRVWPAARSKMLEVDGLRHIFEPSLNYVYVPRPSARGTNQLPQFDYELQTLRLLPIEFPDYNAIDSIDSENVLRVGVRNKWQTKRNGEVSNLVNWDLYTDWRLKPRPDQDTFADIYSDLMIRPRAWMGIESLMRYNLHDGAWRMSLSTLTIQPNDTWSWNFSHFYIRNEPEPPPVGLGEGNNLFINSLYYRVNENWGFRAAQHFEARDGRMEEQSYAIYRDLRSWTAALTVRLRDNRAGPDDFSIALTFSLKAFPRYRLGADTVRPYSLLGL